MTPVERLNAAADRLEALDNAATWSPWRTGESWAGGLAVLTDGGHPVALVSQVKPSETAVADADLIATLRPLAAPIAAWLRDEVRIFDVQVKREGDHDWHDDAEGGCGHYRSPAPLGAYCTCFARPLAVATAILGGTS